MRTGMICLALVAAAACGGPDRDAWQRELQAQGVQVRDWTDYQDAWLDACASEGFGYFVTMTGDPVAVTLTNVRYACPDRMSEAELALGR